MKKFISVLWFSIFLAPVFSQEYETVEILSLPEVNTNIENSLVEEIPLVEAEEKITIAEENSEPVEAVKETEVVTENKTEPVATEPVVAESEIEKKDLNAIVQQLLLDDTGIVLAYRNSLSKPNDSVEIIKLIENKKSDILSVRDLIKSQTAIYNYQIDEQLEKDKSEILNAPVLLAESNGMGELSDAARIRRQSKINELEKDAAAKKKAYLDKIQSDLGSNEKKELGLLASYYKDLEGHTYSVNSLSEGFSHTIEDFNVDDGCWYINFRYRMPGIEETLNTTVKIPYQEITGKKFISIDKMNDAEFNEFQENLYIYSQLFKELPEVFFGKLDYVVYRWKLASEYRMVPVSLEVSYLPNKNKIVAKQEKNLSPRIFVMNPPKEVRTKAEISADAVNATKIIAKEAKESESEADRLYREYTNNFENARTANSKEPVIQKGRGAFIISTAKYIEGDYIDGLINAFDPEALIPDLVSMELDFPLTNFGFWGLSSGVYLPVEPGNINFQFGFNFGFNFMITNHFRPYIQAAAVVDTKYNGILKAGGGLDIILGKRILLNLGYNYKWNYDFNNLLNPDVDTSMMTEEEKKSIPFSTGHKISIGVGIAW